MARVSGDLRISLALSADFEVQEFILGRMN